MAVQKYDIRRPEREGGGFEVRYWSLRNSPVLDENKRLKYVIHRVQDVSDYVPLHQRESQHEREIVNRSQEQRTNEQLRAANSAKNDFLSRMSHALRSPLGAIMGFGQLLEFGELDDQQREYANAIKYNRRGGDVRVAVTGAADERVRVSVADLGHGIEQASLEKLRRARRSREPSAETEPLLSVQSYAGVERRLLYIEDTVANVKVIEGLLERHPSIRLIPAMLGRLGLDLA